jgi:hypothetical protein
MTIEKRLKVIELNQEFIIELLDVVYQFNPNVHSYIKKLKELNINCKQRVQNEEHICWIPPSEELLGKEIDKKHGNLIACYVNLIDKDIKSLIKAEDDFNMKYIWGKPDDLTDEEYILELNKLINNESINNEDKPS